MWGDAPFVALDTGADTFVFDASTDFGDDTVKDAGIGDVEDTVQFTDVTDGNGGGVDLSDLELLVVVTDDSSDVLVAFGDTGASILFEGLGDGTIDSIAALDATDEVEIVVEG